MSTQLILPCTLVSPSGTPVKSKSFLDSGATYVAFIDVDFARANHFPLLPLPTLVGLVIANGCNSSNGPITYYTDLRHTIRGHTETLRFYATKLGRFQIILGKPWLNKHNPVVDWPNDSLCFNKAYCRANCLPPSIHQEYVRGVSPPALPKPFPSPPAFKDISSASSIDAAGFIRIASMDTTEVLVVSLAEVCEALGEEIPDINVPFDPHFDQEILAQGFEPLLALVNGLEPHPPPSSATPVRAANGLSLAGPRPSWVAYMPKLDNSLTTRSIPSNSLLPPQLIH